MRRLRHYLSVLVDENSKRDIRLNFLRVQRWRIPERKFLVEHHRKDIRPWAHAREGIVATSLAASCNGNLSCKENDCCGFLEHRDNLPLSCAGNELVEKRKRFDWCHPIRLQFFQLAN